jgi:ABC-2 type transport system permease protein
VPLATDVASSFFAGILSFFVPLVAVIGSYSSYGKDRITGVLESVLARPVTRRGVAISRFLSTILAISIATIASVGIVDLILNSVIGSSLSASYMLSIVAGLLVEISAFTGLVFLFSHLFKSTGALLGLSIGLFIFLDFFWGLIIFLLTIALGGTIGSAVFLQATIISYYANPAQFVALVNIFVLQTTSGIAIQASNYGLTLPALVLVGIFWSVAPFIIFLYLAVKRD